MEMFEGYSAEHVVRDRERERVRRLHGRAVSGVTPAWHDRAVLSGDLCGWSWRRTGAVLGTVGMALVVSVALPLSLQGLVWGLREVLMLLSR